MEQTSHLGDDLAESSRPTTSELISISLAIENRYEGGDMIPTTVTGALIPAPPARGDADAQDAWEYEHIFSFTGTGRTSGNSWYDVTVTACSDPSLIGKTYEFGY
ncbi:hypothetical protein EEZ25_21980 [Micromonospora aurantiaca]|uniref:hypothetical protein n=1 Tax=Micromonospora aurantiaca (nom. illeg.) TaxID=47850 RepID=UPI000F4155B3|nr:hypothetical protein [Micromonospora aurantiaca]RNH99664.1 hypothetical protein EEZ25_21980 [Micromonospora aurantiaca]